MAKSRDKTSTITSWVSLSSSGVAGLCFALDIEPESLFQVAWAITSHLYSGASDIVLPILRQNHRTGGWQPSVQHLGVTESATIASLLESISQADGDGSVDLTSVLEDQQHFYVADPNFNMQTAKLSGEGVSATAPALSRAAIASLTVSLQPYFILQVRGLQELWRAAVSFSDSSRREEAETLLRSFRTIYHRLLSSSADFGLGLGALDFLSFPAAARLSRWNDIFQEDRDECVQDFVAVHGRQTPDALAVCAWDGNLTYRELEKLSNAVAAHLVAQGAKRGEYILTRMSKSRWNTVATVAIFKAGCVWVPLDPQSLPDHVRNIAKELSAAWLITNLNDTKRLELGQNTKFITNLAELAARHAGRSVKLAKRDSSALATAFFTSGSTGQPKGVIHNHRSICNGIRDVLEPFHMDNQTRCLQLSSPAFDVTVTEILAVLYIGGCVCIPEDQKLLNNMDEEMARFAVTHAVLTSTLATQVHPQAVPSLRYLILGGEPLRKTEMVELSPHLNLINTYGGTEMGVWETATPSLTPSSDHRNVGKTVGAKMWVVHPHNHEILLPTGAVGELLVESVALAQGYHRPVSRRAFIKQPEWRTRFGGQKNTRFYLSGDLAQYQSDGSLILLGRKDTQVKLRGLRIELGEVEYHLKKALPGNDCIAEVVKLPSSRDSAALAAFIALPGVQNDAASLLKDKQRQELGKARDRAVAELSRALPTYSVPTVFIPVDSFPRTITGKTDRKKLRALAKAMTPERLSDITNLTPRQTEEPLKDVEKKMRSIWAQGLGISSNLITRKTNFFHAGGDSVAAMKTVALARSSRLPIGLADIQRLPVLEDLAAFAFQDMVVKSGGEETLPFSLVQNDTDSLSELRGEAAQQCGVSIADIEDLYPCTPLQEGLISLSAKEDNVSYITRKVFVLPSDIRVPDFQNAWKHATTCHPILRTRLVDVGSHGILQAVLRGDSPIWTTGTSLDEYSSQDQKENMGFGTALSRYAIIEDAKTGSKFFVWTIHHSIYDGWTMPILQEAVTKAYRGDMVARSIGFGNFIKYTKGIDAEASRHYWASYLKEINASFFPAPLSTTQGCRSDDTAVRHFPWSWTASKDIHGSAVLRAAWAIVAGTYSGSHDVVFGTTLSGRNTPGISGLDLMTGPTITTVPIRVRWEPGTQVRDLLEKVQREATEMVPFEQTGLQNIARASADAQAACRFTSLFLIQPGSVIAEDSSEGVFGQVHSENEAGFDTHAFSIECQIGEGELGVVASFDSRVLDRPQVERLLVQFQHTLVLLGSSLSSTISRLDLLTPTDSLQIQQWNSDQPKVVMKTAHELVRKQASLRPRHTALDAWDGKMSYTELDEATDRLAYRLRSLGVGPDVLVPISFEKSIWAVVAMLGVLKAGGAFAVLDPAHPADRKASIVQQLKATIALVSQSAEKLLPAGCVPTTVVCDDSILSWPHPDTNMPRGSPKDAMYVIFTSGSTGTPKGCLTEHWAFCSSMHAFAEGTNLKAGNHVLQFASYSFDTSLEETFCTLFAGATLHIPSEHTKMNDLAGEIRRTKTDWMELTPKVASLLEPNEIPTLKTVIFGADRSNGSDVCRWPATTRLLNSYGCTEASVTSTLIPLDTRANEMPPIGKGVGCNLWVVDVNDYNKLVPIGAPGELLIEGPGLARGYLGDFERTARSFIFEPLWARDESPQWRRFYRTGDLVRLNSDGAVFYIDRIDSQVKIRGQRVELGEIEHNLNLALPQCRVAAEVVTIQKQEGSSTTSLAAFVVLTDSSTGEAAPCLDADSIKRLAEARTEAVANLSRSLPAYMIPDVFIPISKMPLTVSDKTDRRKLKALAQALTWEQVAAVEAQSSVKTQPRTEAEAKMQAAWASVLGVAPEKIGIEDNFFRMGGDSIAAIRLVAAAGKLGIGTSVAEVFRNPILADLASSYGPVAVQPEQLPPFSLIDPEQKEEFLSEAAQQCGLRPDEIEDLYPCTPLQESLVSLTAKHHGSYVMRQVFTLPKDTRMAEFHSAWEETAQAHPILRTRIVSVDSTMLQVVTSRHPGWSTAADLDSYMERDAEQMVGLGAAMSRYAIILHEDRLLFVWTMHHAIYDGWSLPLLLKDFLARYEGRLLAAETAPGFNLFINHLLNMDETEAKNFWASYLEGSSSMFPVLQPSGQNSRPNTTMEDNIDLAIGFVHGVTPSTLLRVAWALVTHTYTGEPDVVFGTTLNGRNAPVAGIDRISGPTIATVPFRARWDDDLKIRDLLEDIQQKTTAMIPFEQMGLQNISSVSHDAQAACQFQTLFVVQQEEEEGEELSGVMRRDEASEAETWANFATYPLLVECTMQQKRVSFLFSYSTDVLEHPQVANMMRQFKHVLSKLASGSASLLDTPIADFDLLNSHDRMQLDHWNTGNINPIQKSMHQLFSETVASQPTRPAISSWDGNMTYADLDAASGRLASYLRRVGVGSGPKEEMVLFCFEKSRMAIISMLGILKAGAAFVGLDPSQPDERLATIMQLSKARLVLTSKLWSERLEKIAQGELKIVRSADVLAAREKTQVLRDFNNNPDALAYVIFTSGSTGVPKGVLITHRAASSSIVAHGSAFDVDSSSRTLQFSSLTFDACIFEIFTTLVTGGCLCIPSDADRVNDLAGAINNMFINTVMLTPTVLALLDPESVPSVNKLIFIAEQVTDKDIQRWSGRCRTMNGYGPTECTVVCVVEQDLRIGGRIGKAVGCRLWVVKPDNSDKLVPVGCPGELLVESPSLARGYLNDETRTNASFIWDPAWAHSEAPGQRRRFYKTGDLVRQTHDGAFMYLGRKDTQIKLRGQRIELGEVDHHLKRAFPSSHVVADLVHLQQQMYEDEQDTSTVAALAAFVVIAGAKSRAEDLDADSLEVVGEPAAKAIQSLQHALPVYMVPSIFIPIDKIPVTVSGKTDRMRLKAFARRLTPKQQEILRAAVIGRASGGQGPKLEPLKEAEKQMRSAWSKVLKLDAQEIGSSDNFFRLGGDSISAMKLVPASRLVGMPITVADIFRSPVLSDLCELAASNGEFILSSRFTDAGMDERVAPYSLLPAYDNLVRQDAARQCRIHPDEIEDMCPCTPLQQGLLSLSAKEGGSYVVREVFRLRHVRASDFQKAWIRTTQAHPILRTRLVYLDKLGTLQVVVSNAQACPWTTVSSTLEEYLERDARQTMGLGTPLCRFGLVRSPDGGDAFFVWSAHHAIFDGWTKPIIRESVAAAYSGLAVNEPPPFNRFIKYSSDLDVDAANTFWASYLQDSSASQFPAAKDSSVRGYHVDEKFEDTFQWKWQSSSDVTASIALRTAWALVVGVYTSSSDVVFGTTLSGRNAPVPGVEMMTGPTIATVPMRIHWDADVSVSTLLSSVQRQATDMIPFEQVGLQAISKVNASAMAACQFRSLFVVQPATDTTTNISAHQKLLDSMMEPVEFHEDDGMAQTYPLGIAVDVHDDWVHVEATYDKAILDQDHVQRIMSQLRHTLSALSNNLDATVSTLDLLSQADACQIQEWNGDGPPPSIQESIHELVRRQALARPKAPAVSAWDGELTYGELDRLANGLAHRLRTMGVGLGGETIVPISFEKSKWVAVAMLGVLKAGGAYVPLDASQPAERLKFVVEQVDARILLTSPTLAQHPNFTSLPLETIVWGPSSSVKKQHPPEPRHKGASGDALAYLLFTSGSTGVPKGVMVSHSAAASSILANGPPMGITNSSRVLQFSSYGFDASVLEILGTLLIGGCVCIPSADECTSDLNEAVQKYGVNFAALATRVASLLRPEEVPGIKAIAVGGEAVTASDIERWQGRLVTNGYGPTECAIVCVIESSQHKLGRIGKGVGCTTWIVDADNPDHLAPIGAPGELLIEGPCLARGYLKEQEKTAASFVSDLAWAKGGQGRRRRFYKTGDLVRYDADGGIIYIGRKDTQIKLRGLRIELGEVEHHLCNVFPNYQVAADVVGFKQKNKEPALAAFIVLHEDTGSTPEDDSQSQHGVRILTSNAAELSQIWATGATELPRLLPGYMVPTVFIPLSAMPLTSSGKTNRRQLQAIASNITIEQLEVLRDAHGTKEMPQTEAESVLQMLWAQTLDLEPAKIGVRDNFFRLGGDSVSAMRLVSAAAAMGFSLRASDVFRHPVLQDLCSVLRQEHSNSDPDNNSTSATTQSDEEGEGSSTSSRHLFDNASLLTPASSVSDLRGKVQQQVAPATDFQALAFEFSHLKNRGFVNYFSFEFLVPVSREQIRAACTKLVRHHSILRTSLAVSKGRLWQLVAPASTALAYIEMLHTNGDAAEFASNLIEMDEARRLSPSEDTTKFFVIESAKLQSVHLVMRLSHSHYDGMSLPLVLQTFSMLLTSKTPSTHEVPFAECTLAVEALSSKRSFTYWRTLLEGSCMTPILTPPAVLANDGVEGLLARLVPLPDMENSGITFACVLKAAWAVVLAQHSHLSDVVFGCLVSGRTPLGQRYSSAVGPCVNLIPVRLNVAGANSTRRFLQAVKDQHANSMEHEHMGFRRIANSCTTWPARTSFAGGSIVQHQNIPLAADFNKAAPGLPFELSARGSTGNAAAVWIITTARPAERVLAVDFSYAQHTIPTSVAEGLVQGLCVAIEHFSRNWDRDVPLPRTTVEWEGMPAALPCGNSAGDNKDEETEHTEPISRRVEALVENAWQKLYQAHSKTLPHVKGSAERTALSMFEVWDDNLVAIELRRIYNDLGVYLEMQDLLERPTMGGQLEFLSQQGL